MDDRFQELRRLLQAYEQPGRGFDDTTEVPGTALSACLRVAAFAPEHAARAVREIQDLRTAGLFSEEIADDVDLLPRIRPPRGVGVEDCLRVIQAHLDHFLAAPPPPRPAFRPELPWEWRERFPALARFLGAYFYQDSLKLEYGSHAEAIGDYLPGEPAEDIGKAATEIGGLLTLNQSEDQLHEATTTLGLAEPPPTGVPLRQWLVDLQGLIGHHLRWPVRHRRVP
ncbi:contact-dependent growth inhibition system immunity protein [Streptomyces sp. CSDS2]|uniref:contact-dependent growth inhibition system immunity protein n=1 Tax=Streptomyces sp. CSDS2 TaxID=3055051 RepID=UPI0025B0413B|nr:contact-dependent growth inhibition system immunity protein [Streptomyces sp. CSDS2]MDN3262263.1 contact-dependent growth inhibition system immunity protein [Streptomyces sp. CSDS2]